MILCRNISTDVFTNRSVSCCYFSHRLQFEKQLDAIKHNLHTVIKVMIPIFVSVALRVVTISNSFRVYFRCFRVLRWKCAVGNGRRMDNNIIRRHYSHRWMDYNALDVPCFHGERKFLQDSILYSAVYCTILFRRITVYIPLI